MGKHSAAEIGDLIAPRRRDDTRPVVEDQDYMLMLMRMIRAAEYRATQNPEMLPQLVLGAQRLAEAANVAIAVNAERYAVNPYSAASMGECARVLGISKQSASERRARGQEVIDRRVDAAGATRFSEAARERDAVQAAAEHARTNLVDFVERRARRAA